MDNKEKMALTPKNYLLMLIGAAVVLLGLLLMVGGTTDDLAKFNADELFSFRRITLAPIVIVGGFSFVIYAIMKPNKPNKDSKQTK